MKHISFNPDIDHYAKEKDWAKIIVIGYVVLSAVFFGCVLATQYRASEVGSIEHVQMRWVHNDCKKTSEGNYDCTDEATLNKAKENPLIYVYAETITAPVTAYSPEESPGINAKGYKPRLGFSIACPREVHLGTRVRFRNWGFVCDDRTSLFYNGRFDQFVGSRREAFAWGIRKEKITLFYQLNKPRIIE